MSKRLSYEFVKKGFEKEGYTLLSTEYINNSQKLEYICPCGTKHSVTWGCWGSGDRCPCCSGKFKKTIGFIKLEFEKEGYTLLTKEYINNKQKLDYLCPNGKIGCIRWNDWQQGHRCICNLCDLRIKVTIEQLKGIFFSEGYILLSTEYINAETKLRYICPNGNIHATDWHAWQLGTRCFCIECKKRHPRWKGGISKEPYCQDWGKDLKGFVKERDGHRCLNPDCWDKDKTLSVHHIDYNKKSCVPENLITVCRSCNSRANTDREWHKAWYKAILNKRYSYFYNEGN